MKGQKDQPKPAGAAVSVDETEIIYGDKLESLSILAGGIAHDFNNLLTAILGNIALAKSCHELGNEAIARMDEAEQATLRARELALQLMSFARGNSPAVQPASVAETIRDAASFARHGTGIACRFNLPDNLWAVAIDAGQIQQVIGNLLLNAHEVMPDGGTVSIGADNITVPGERPLPLKPGKYVAVHISDRGGGISAKNLSRIFEPYFTTKPGGSGLGLATTRIIMQHHHGHIAVESQPGEGTTFHLYLPASREPAPVTAAKPVSAAPRRQGNILVMDDEDVIRRLLTHILEDIGYRVDTTVHGGETVAAYRQAAAVGRPYDAVILDLTVSGGMGGRETIRRLREIDPKVRAIVSSGYCDDPVMANYAAHGFKDVVTKPYTVDELETVLSRVLAAA